MAKGSDKVARLALTQPLPIIALVVNVSARIVLRSLDASGFLRTDASVCPGTCLHAGDTRLLALESSGFLRR